MHRNSFIPVLDALRLNGPTGITGTTRTAKAIIARGMTISNSRGRVRLRMCCHPPGDHVRDLDQPARRAGEDADHSGENVRRNRERSTSSIEQSLLHLHQNAGTVLRSSALDHAKEIGRILQQEVDLGKWSGRLARRPEMEPFDTGRRELGFAIYSASTGLYRQAYNSVRLFLELSFAAVLFSTNEIARRSWRSDGAHFKWGVALDPKTGILSPDTVRLFLPAAVGHAAEYSGKARHVYDHCSAFTHGRPKELSTLPDRLTYAPSVLADWCSTAQVAAECVLYLLVCRFGEELLPADDGSLAATLDFSLSHLRFVRERLGDVSAREAIRGE
jgi:hypothetical protein